MMRYLSVISFAVLGFALTSCLPPSQMRQVETNNASLRAQVDSLRAQVQRLRTTVAKAELAGQKAEEASLRMRADNDLRLNQFAEQIRILNDRVDDMDNRLSNMPGKLRMVSEKPAASNANPPAGAVPEPRPEEADTEEMKKLYDAAYQDLVRGQGDLAREGFQEFLRKYPQSSLADNAQYWIGESYYSQKDYARAAAEFLEVPAKYPNSDKIAAAALKRAYAMLGLNRQAEGKALLEQLIRQFPRTPEADLARAKLQE